MVLSLKCGNCGFINMSSDDSVMFEIDFLDKRILYICPQCKHNNQLSLSDKKEDKKDTGGLPPMAIMRG